jgi:hypothetical protein
MINVTGCCGQSDWAGAVAEKSAAAAATRSERREKGE